MRHSWSWFPALVLCVTSCGVTATGDAEVPSASHTAAPHGPKSTAQTTQETTTPVELTFVSTEVIQAQLELTPTGLEAELVRDASIDIHRAEALWGRADDAASDDAIELVQGDVVEASFTTTLDLGGADESGIWAVSWQLIGPDQTGAWPAPPLALTVGNGSWRIGGGDGHPDGSREEYADIDIPFRDGQTISWDIRVSLESGAGAVDAWADGVHVVKSWQPPGGTMYPNQPHVLMKTGLYTGGGGAAGLQSRLEIVDATATVHTAPEQ